MIILESFISMFWDIAPIIGMILIFQLFIIKEKIPNLTQTLFGIFMVWIGLALFIVGLEKALFPIGKSPNLRPETKKVKPIRIDKVPKSMAPISGMACLSTMI